MDGLKSAAIILAAGQGKRMGSNIPKQYLIIRNKPILYYTLKAFEESEIQQIILVVGKDEIEYCREQIVEQYKFQKVFLIIEGGSERYLSVYKGLSALEKVDYVLIHDGARPLVESVMINHLLSQVNEHKACILGMPVKDTIKIVNENAKVESTPPRNKLWLVQTPQAFSYSLIKNAYDKLIERGITIATDDAMVLELMEYTDIKMIPGGYQNIKITTPDDIKLAEAYLADCE